MRAAALDQRDIGKFALAKPIAETGDKLETRRSAANDDDSVQMMSLGGGHEIRKPPARRPAHSKRQNSSRISPASRRIG